MNQVSKGRSVAERREEQRNKVVRGKKVYEMNGEEEWMMVRGRKRSGRGVREYQERECVRSYLE